MTMNLSLLPHGGLAGPCPSCGLPSAMTEWHQAGLFGPSEATRRRVPCADPDDLDVSDGGGGHLRRSCPNCGHGWAEACTGRAAPAPQSAPPPARGFALGAGLAATAAGTLLGRALAGTALLVAWLAVIIAIAVIAWAGHAALAARSAPSAAESPAAR